VSASPGSRRLFEAWPACRPAPTKRAARDVSEEAVQGGASVTPRPEESVERWRQVWPKGTAFTLGPVYRVPAMPFSAAMALVDDSRPIIPCGKCKSSVMWKYSGVPKRRVAPGQDSGRGGELLAELCDSNRR